MASLLWTSVVFALAAAFSAASLCLWLRERGIRPVRCVAAFLSRHTTPGRVLLGALFVVMWMFASVKPNGGSRGAVAPADEWEGFAPITSTNTTRTLDGDDFRRGFVLTRVGTNETHNFAASSNAVVCADWLTFGAAEDWVYENVEWRMENVEWGTGDWTRLRVHSDGWVEVLGGPVFCPFKAALGIVPEANWGPLAETTTPSLFWHALTPSGSLVLTWRNALFGRDADAPVSVQMEAWPGGRFVYRYDLRNVKWKMENGEWDVANLTNVVVGAALGGMPYYATLADVATNVSFSIFNSPFSISFHTLLPEDAANHDRDGDWLSLLDELFFYDTDPRRPDTDFDGVSDGGEVAAGTDPLLRDTDGDGFADGTDVRPLEADAWADADGDGLPDAWKDGWFGTDAVVAADADANADGISNLAALLMGVNPLAPCVDGFSRPGSAGVTTAWEISPVAFSFSRPDGLTNLVRRTFAVERESPWEQFFVSSRPDGAAGWEMDGAALFYGLDGGPATNAVPSSSGDSWRVPLGEAMPQTVTFRLEATGGAPSLSAPLYLLRWAPRVEFLPSENVTVVAATNGHVYAAAKRDPGTGAYGIPFRADLSGIPRLSGAGADVAADLALPPADGVAVSNGMFTAGGPLMADLPRGGTGPSKRLLFYGVGVGRVGAVSAGPRASRLSSPYPLTSSALRRAFHAATGAAADGSVAVSLSPNVPELGCVAAPAGGGPRLRGTVSGGEKTGVVMPPATLTPTVCGEPCTNDVHEVAVVYPEDHDGTHPEDDEDDGGCGCCGDGGSSIGSFRIRIPFGEPAEGEHLGFLWAVVDGPTAITPSVFRVLAAQGVSAVTNADGTLSVSCAAAGGKTLMVTNTAHGVAVPVWNASGRFESQWEVWNEGGDESRIRVRRTTVLGNATVDETYATWTDWAPEVFGDVRGPATVWEKSDNIRGVSTRRHEWRDADEPGFITSEYDETSLDGNLVRAEERTYAKVGEGSTARRRPVRTYGCDELGWYDTVMTYWCDTDHPDRHARLRSETSDRRPWSWRDYDDAGRETVRVEQLDGSPFPELAEVSPGAALPQGCSARVTVTGYEPQEGDDAHRNDSFEPREVSVYVRRGSAAPILVSHETRVYTRETDAVGNPLRRVAKTVGFGGLTRTETTVEYPRDGAVPSHLRGLRTLVSNADGSETATAYALSNGCLVAESRTFFGGVERQTYRRTVSDAAHRLTLREETRLSSDGALLEWSERTYDDMRQLRSVAYSDGTSETNAYSCCRLLWRRDRQGRRVLRSAETGTDSLYCADEDAWLADVSADGAHRVTRHYFDGFGRETNTVVGISYTPGASASPTSILHSTLYTLHSYYHDEQQCGYSETTDERGAVTMRWRSSASDCEWQSETVLTNETEVLTTTTTTCRNGGTAVRREWTEDSAQSPYRWTEERRFADYAADGRRVEYVVTESHDCGVVTNSVSTYDLLGRLVSSEKPCVATTPSSSPFAATAYDYDGTSSRILSSTYTAGDVVRTTACLYDDFGEQVGTVLDGVSTRTDTAYETDASNVVWRVETTSVTGSSTNSLTIVRTQLTGLSDACRRHTVTITGTTDILSVGNGGTGTTGVPPVAGTVTETFATYDPSSGIETETVTSSIAPTIVRRYLHGVLLSTQTNGETTFNSYDAFGRLAATSRTGVQPVPDGATGTTGILPVASYSYSPNGDLLAAHTYTNGDEVVSETYAYDMLGNRIATTDALGNTTYRNSDPFGRVVAEWGATYPVRFTYDTAGRRTSLSTTRDGVTWDTTTWAYDASTGNCISKTYADGSTVTYTYTPDSLPLRTTYASGRWKENVYDSQRRLCGVIYSSPNMDYGLQLDEYGRTTYASNVVAQTCYAINEIGCATNEIRTTDNITDRITRTFDRADRLTDIAIPERGYEQRLAYSVNGLLSTISNSDVVVTYDYSDDLRDVGYTMAFADGGIFTSAAGRDPYRRDLVVSVANSCGGNTHTFEYSYDALSRPVSRNADTFGYNDRSEVSSADIDGNSETHEYDGIGNATFATFNFATNFYAANNLNQYTSILCGSATLRETTHDADGNLTFDGVFTYAYDAENRLASVSSNVFVLVTNQYDYNGRRVRRTTSTSETTFLYDGWNLIYEREIVGAVTNETFYYWGKDISGSLQGAGGVGGLLYLKRNDTIYIPHRDANGNIVQYTDTSGNVVAEYNYGAFGNTLSATGALSDMFRFRFSTKYFDAETGLYYYGYRFYSPSLMRWLNRDPIEEEGGLNLHGFCSNNAVSFVDIDGTSILITEDNSVVKDRISTKARAAFFPSASVSFSCSWRGVLNITGVASRRIEIITPNMPRWNQRMKRYNNKWRSKRTNTTEWMATYAHEMDHWNAFNAFFAFLHLLNEFDGTSLCNKCNEMKEELELQFNRMWTSAFQHSSRYDLEAYNYGGAYPNAK